MSFVDVGEDETAGFSIAFSGYFLKDFFLIGCPFSGLWLVTAGFCCSLLGSASVDISGLPASLAPTLPLYIF